jgi:hypothetical protein
MLFRHLAVSKAIVKKSRVLCYERKKFMQNSKKKEFDDAVVIKLKKKDYISIRSAFFQ